jgi:Tol biopolymer transport system component
VQTAPINANHFGSGDGMLFSSPVWSPEGHWIAYDKFRFERTTMKVDRTLNVKQGTRNVIITQPQLEWGLEWLADGRLIYALAEPPSQNTRISDRNVDASMRPICSSKITSGDDYVNQPSVTADGKRLLFSRSNHN